MSILEVKNIKKNFTLEKNKIEILKGISVKIKKGEFVAIMGSSGSGKSTFLSIIAGLDKPTSGSVTLDNEILTNLNEDKLAKMRNEKIGFIFQSFYLIPSLTAKENVMFPLEISKKLNEKKVDGLLERVKLSHRKNNYPNQLSGGEKQRVAISRALINNPAIIFADEPTGNLDSKNGEDILKLLLELKEEFKTTLVVVTHEEKLAKKADRILMLKDGKIEKEINNGKN